MAFSAIFTLFVAGILLLIIIPSQICLASGIESEETNLSSDADLLNQTEGDESVAQEGIPVHVYITNNDNERLDVSLFIDSELMDRKEVSSESDQKFDSYPLENGKHSFKITWWDEDVKSSFEMEEAKDISAETSVNLYTTLNEEPEEFEVTVNLVNENSRELEAFLYADGSFEKSKKVGKESSAELGTIKLEEGIHNLSVRWEDGETRIEYEKTKKMSVKRDEAIIFYAPKGVSFESSEAPSPGSKNRPSVDSDKKSGAKDEPLDQKSPLNSSAKNNSSDDNLKDSDAPTDELDAGSEGGAEKDQATNPGDEAKEEAEDKASEKADTSMIGSGAGRDNDLRKDSSQGTSSQAKNANSMIGESLEEGGRLYVYAALILLAIYLLIRH